jgi:hypothetical protein
MCDGREQAQTKARTILAEHLLRANMRGAVMAHLEREGVTVDMRPQDLREAMSLVREMLAAGFRVLSDSRGHVELKPPVDYLADDSDWGRLADLAKRFNALRQQERGSYTLTRAVRFVTALPCSRTVKYPSGIAVLEARPC